MPKGHIDARHQGKVERHVTFVAIAKVGTDIGRRLVGFGQDEAVCVFGINGGADFFDDKMGLRQVFAGCSIAFDQVGNGVHAQRIDAHVEPEPHGFQYLFHHRWVIEVEVWLVGKEAVPIVGLGRIVPSPIGLFRVGEDDVGILVEMIRTGPDVHLARRRAGRSEAGGLEPWVLIAGVIDDQFDQNLHIALVRCIQK